MCDADAAGECWAGWVYQGTAEGPNLNVVFTATKLQTKFNNKGTHEAPLIIIINLYLV